MGEKSIVSVKSKAFAIRVVKLCRYLNDDKREFVLSKQLLRCGTSIGANVREAECAQSRADFFAKLYVAYKEANETAYWLELLFESGILAENEFSSIYSECRELLLILAAITKQQKTVRN